MADSRCEMLAKCQQSGSMTVMANDTESAADVLCWCRLSRIDAHCWWNQLAAIACDPPTYWLTPHCHRWLRWRISIACIPLDALPPLRPVWTSPPAAQKWRSHPSIDLYAAVNFWTFFDVHGGGQHICESTYMWVYMVCEFSHKIGLAHCEEENCVVH